MYGRAAYRGEVGRGLKGGFEGTPEVKLTGGGKGLGRGSRPSDKGMCGQN